MLEATTRASTPERKSRQNRSEVLSGHSCTTTVKPKCHFYQGNHVIYYYKNFLALAVSQRVAEIRSRKLCVNCLRSSSHASSKCTSDQCKVCQTKHNTLLHMPSTTEPSTNIDKEVVFKAIPPFSVLASHVSRSFDSEQVILSTAVVLVCDSDGSHRAYRVLLDCRSQANFISKKFVEALDLETRSLNVSISGVNGTAITSNHMARIKLQSLLNSYTAAMECIVTDQIIDKFPAVSSGQI